MSLIPAAYRGGGGEEDLVGQTLAGWRVERLLGRGGMGAVYLGRAAAGGALVVLKVLAPEVAEDPHVRERFRREWQALHKLPAHPHLVGVIAVEEVRERPVIVMEYVAGVTLLQHARARGGQVPPAEAAELIRQVASGLEVVHQHHLLHRDVNPNNVVRTAAGQAKVVDFGLAKDLLRSTRLTETGQVMGTAFYLAPEQFDGRAGAGPACDVFALGATLYHLLAGRPPFVAPDLAELAGLIAAGDCEPIRELAPSVPLDLERVLLQMLEPELRFRYRRMEDVALDLGRVLTGEAPSAPCLVGASGGRALLLPGRRFTLGSDPGCELPVPLPGVAPRHAQVRKTRAGFVLCDLRSPTGTFVGDVRVAAEPILLSDGDSIRVGEVTLTYRDPRQPSG